MEGLPHQQRQLDDLSLLFGQETVVHATLLDVVDFNLTEEMVASISNGVKNLKQLRNDRQAQQKLIEGMEAGQRLLVCLWIMEMDLLEKIQTDSF